MALEVVALVGPAESGVSCGRYCRRCAALWTGSRPWRSQVSDHAVPISGDSVVELHHPYPVCHVRQTHESVRRLSYRCRDSRFRGVSVAAFVCVWAFLTAVNLGVVAGA